jgi:hypothetical protein
MAVFHAHIHCVTVPNNFAVTFSGPGQICQFSILQESICKIDCYHIQSTSSVDSYRSQKGAETIIW